MKVTFDTQVWEQMVFPERHPNHPDLASMVTIKDAVSGGRIQGFICESFGTMEAIRRQDRAAYSANKKPIVETLTRDSGDGLISVSMTFKTNHSLHPGLHPKQDAALSEALAIGIRLLSAPYLNQPAPARLLNAPEMYAPEVFASADYNERFGDAISSIQARGVGNGIWEALLRKITERLGPHRTAVRGDVQLLEYAYVNAQNAAEKREIEKAFAEAADGDAIAAHIAFGNDWFCTEDQGRSAGGPSILNPVNRAWLQTAHGVKFATMRELADLL